MADVDHVIAREAPDVEEVLSRTRLFRKMPWTGPGAPEWAPLVEREWLLTNGLGGYASGTVLGLPTRRYHGLLVGALPAPLGRTLMLAELSGHVRLADGAEIRLGGQESIDRIEPYGADWLAEFRLDWGLPVWTYDMLGTVLERRVVMPHQQNTVAVRYRLIEGQGPIDLELQPLLNFRSHDDAVDAAFVEDYTLQRLRGGWEIARAGFEPRLRVRAEGDDVTFHEKHETIPELRYRIEAARGYDAVGRLFSPGTLRLRMEPGQEVFVLASTESWDALGDSAFEPMLQSELRRRARLITLAHPSLREAPAAELLLAADGFVIVSPRAADAARAHAEGQEARSIVAGYHWFTDWGRDTMISLEGLTLVTGRKREAGQILRTFGRHMRGGLIPNLFPEGGNEGLYHTADATLWFFHAIDRYLDCTGDRRLLDDLIPCLRESIDHHVEGTHFGIGIDAGDGLLHQGAPGYQLTWMDAKVGDWVVTPRRGKAVEINALWYNALCLMERWEREYGEDAAADRVGELAQRARESFNRRFWNNDRGYLYDVVDGESGDDDALRPNQVFAISMPHPVLREDRWEPVLTHVERKLLTPFGLRSLSPDHPDYEPVYFGDLRARDAAYHQGTVWGWLIGPYVDAWLKVHPGTLGAARALLHGLTHHLDDFCIGTLAEIFDGEEPHRPRGCVAQAWTVAEVLRCWVRTER